jgi:hypothetical protein
MSFSLLSTPSPYHFASLFILNALVSRRAGVFEGARGNNRLAVVGGWL